MTNTWNKLTFAAVLVLTLLVAGSMARGAFGDGGALEPGGPPAPGMKSLQEVEPRTPISSIPYTISQPGSYYLTSNLTPASDLPGITVFADNVTIDLNGFTLRGFAGSTNGGIDAQAGDGLVVRNGAIQGWGYVGVSAAGNTAVIEDLVLTDGTGFGIIVSGGSVVRNVDISGGQFGITVFGKDNLVADNVVTGATVRGIELSAGGGPGSGTRNRIENNTVNGNGTGIEAFAAPNVIVENSASGNTTNYSIVGGNFAPVAAPPTTDPWANISY
jgi:parallel beta-helix repeat protein